ncbi:hypothetical protein F441_22827, partial [Phytophthora nicotianae CJ01A1]
MKRPPEDALDGSTDRLTCAERWERILEQQEYNEGRLDSGVTDEDLFEAQLSGDSSDSGSASNGDGGDSNEESARCSQELQGITEMMNVSTRVQSGSGAEVKEKARQPVERKYKLHKKKCTQGRVFAWSLKSAEEAMTVLDKTYMSVARVLTTEGSEVAGEPRVGHYEHPANKIGLEDYAKELAFLLDFTEESNMTIDYGAPNVKNSCLTTGQQERLVATLKKNERILIASGNALPPPAYGV